MPSAIGFCEVIQSVIFLCIAIEVKAGIVNHTDNLVFFLKVCDTSYFFSVFVRSKITYRITKAIQQQRRVGAGKSSTKIGQKLSFCCWDF